MSKKDVAAQLKDLKKMRHDWEEGGEHKGPYPLNDLIAELEGKGDPQEEE